MRPMLPRIAEKAQVQSVPYRGLRSLHLGLKRGRQVDSSNLWTSVKSMWWVLTEWFKKSKLREGLLSFQD